MVSRRGWERERERERVRAAGGGDIIALPGDEALLS